jgi:hypothetical protein
MKVTRKYNQHRRDCWCDMKCEGCGHGQTYKSAYDDRNFWDNVVPSFKCEGCGKSSNDLGAAPVHVSTRYAADQIV